MKTLIIVRHGKSDWSFEVDDIDRPLKERGVNDAYKMSKKLMKKNIIPELIISSPATRALHSATIFARELKFNTDRIKINETLYFSYIEEILNEIFQIDNNVSCVMIFGHNPTFTNFANKFVKTQIENIPTSGLVILKFDTDEWSKINKDNLKEEFFDYPKK